MATENATCDSFEVEITNKTIVKASGPSPGPHTIRLSNLDLLSGRFPVTYIYFYSPKTTQSNNHSIGTLMKDSLEKCLGHFYPFAGTIIDNEISYEPEISCNNTGALLIEARASVSLKSFDFYNLDRSLKGKLVPVFTLFPVQIQITNFTCGGLSITFTFDHALGDATAFGKFLLTWSEIATGKPISCLPDHSRDLRARTPPNHDQSLDEEFVSCTLEEIRNMPTITTTLLKRLYYVDKTCVERLQRLASSNNNRTKIEAFSAYVWKVMANAINEEKFKSCKMGWLIDGRTRLSKNGKSMSDSNYIGNVLSLGFEEFDVTGLKIGHVSKIADSVHRAISKVTNEAHFRNLIDWVEIHRPGLMLSKSVIGLGGGPTLVISSGRSFPVAELDFGFGGPVLGTVGSTIERLGVGYMNQRQSAKKDGSWTISAILWPEMIEALESDPEHIFQPMRVNHIQL
ncbi:HXXXD-type acyl-transferase family protein [Striga hermonthica]|uniref:HXXXD-type acyl-transferase family protein n=1 Tax=Striga hermonthica TaxID=68872 RepID=A0A9N7RAQ5_STRHE|nr:HXXXD-type acyl-transferase family protein [Striga hermonthica]